MSLTIATVMRSGGDFDERWVRVLRRGLDEHAPEHEFVCLTDGHSLVDGSSRQLAFNWPGWWSKAELFRPDLFDDGTRVLYMDLDSLPVGDLSGLAKFSGDFGMTRGFYNDILQSAVMSFRAGTAVVKRLWREWLTGPDEFMRTVRGDGDWIGQRVDAAQLMDLYPGQIVSSKLHAKNGPPPGARLVAGHGQPRFTDPAAGWPHEEWTRRLEEVT